MPGISRIFDICICGKGSIGVYISGSPNTFINGRNVLRGAGTDIYICPHCTGVAIGGSSNVLTNGIITHRLGDTGQDCDGISHTISASGDTFAN